MANQCTWRLSVQHDCIDVQTGNKQNSKWVCSSKSYPDHQVNISHSSKRLLEFHDDCGPSKKMQKTPGNCVTTDLCGNCYLLPCECTVITVPLQMKSDQLQTTKVIW